MVAKLSKLTESHSKDDSERTYHTNSNQDCTKKPKKLRTIKKKIFNTLNHRINCYYCVFPDCSKTFPTYFRWKIHHIIHINEKAYECSKCNKKFNVKGNLSVHMRSHTGERPYKCDQEGCNYTFTTRGNLVRHLNSHKRGIKRRVQLQNSYIAGHEEIIKES